MNFIYVHVECLYISQCNSKIVQNLISIILTVVMPNIEVTSVYYFFKQKLQQNFTEPPGAPDLAQFHLIDMYTRSTHLSVKDKILDRFTSSSYLRIVVATIAFDMGIDCTDVHQVIPWRVLEDIEMYVQETRRAG